MLMAHGRLSSACRERIGCTALSQGHEAPWDLSVGGGARACVRSCIKLTYAAKRGDTTHAVSGALL